MFKKAVVFTAIVGMLAVGIGSAYAQGGRNSNSNGRGGGQNQSTSVTAPRGNQNGPASMNQNGPGSGNGAQLADGTGAGPNNRSNNQIGRGTFAGLPPATEGGVTEDVIALMIDGWEDEMTAFATYEAIIDQFGEIRPFTAIQSAEAQHIDALEFLFDRYGIELPEAPVIELPTFTTVEEACAAGVAAEIANLTMYDEMMVTFADYPDILQVAEALRDASELNHLPAFERCDGQ